MSFAVMACIFTVAFVNMENQRGSAYSALPETKISDQIRYLKSVDEADNAPALISDQKEFDQLTK
jgi:hypothetical protein